MRLSGYARLHRQEDRMHRVGLPADPRIGDRYDHAGKRWGFDGSMWNVIGATPQPWCNNKIWTPR